MKIKIMEMNNVDYKSWKRNNVTYRGIRDFHSSDIYGSNSNYGSFGKGLYTAFLSNKKMASGYGTVYFVVNAKPIKPKVFSSRNEAEIFIQQLMTKYSKINGGIDEREYDVAVRFFNEHTSIEAEMIHLGFDGLAIRGREMVNYTPSSDVRYFKTEKELEQYFYDFVQ